MHTCGSISIIIVPELRDKEKRLNRDIFSAAFRITFLMPRVCFKPVTLYIEMHHVRTIFLFGVMTFLYYVVFIHNVTLKAAKRFVGDEIYWEEKHSL